MVVIRLDIIEDLALGKFPQWKTRNQGTTWTESVKESNTYKMEKHV